MFCLLDEKVILETEKIMVGLMLKIMDSIRIESDFVANNWYLILRPDLLLFSLTSDFFREGKVLFIWRLCSVGFKRNAWFLQVCHYMEKKRTLLVMQINVSSESYVNLLFKISVTEYLLPELTPAKQGNGPS